MSLVIPTKYSPEWREQIYALSKGHKALQEYAMRFSQRVGQDLTDLHYGDFITVEEADLYEVLATNGVDSDTVKIVPEERSNGFEDRINMQKKGDQWIVFYVERGQPDMMGQFSTYDDASRFVAHVLYAAPVTALSAAYRDKHFPGAVIPHPGRPWPDGKIRY